MALVSVLGVAGVGAGSAGVRAGIVLAIRWTPKESVPLALVSTNPRGLPLLLPVAISCCR